MVAVITGNGLGLGNTSLTQLGQSQGGSPSLGQAGNRSYVNSATGNLILQNADEGLLFDGLPLNVLRTYNSLGQLSSNGWSYGFSRTVNGLTGTLNTAGSTITRTDDDSSSVVYTYNATLGVYQSTNQSSAIDTLSWNATSSTWTWTDAADNTLETYNANGQLTALTDTSSGASYSFSYSNGQLAQIVAGDGDTLLFGYNTNNQLISLSIQEVPPGQSAAVTRQVVSYGYDTQGRLAAVTTVLGSDTDTNTAGYSTSYTYVGTTDLIASVTQSDGTTISYTYNANNQIASITTGTGSAAQTLTLSYGTNSTTVTDGLGNATTYQYNAQGQLTSVIAPAVNGSSPTTTYTYDANGNLLTSTDPNGAVTTYHYDVSGNLLSVEDGAGNTTSYTYNANDQVTSKTTYTVPAQGEVGQSGYVAPSGAETAYYVYNANNQLAYTIDPLGAVTEHDYTTANGLSELTTTRQYLGATYSTSSNSPINPPTLSQLQAWVQSSTVQSTLSQSTRTDYTYDVRGQLATQTQYDTVDSSGNGLLSNGTVITTTTYDVQGKLLHTSTEAGSNRSTLQTTTYAYDGLGRMISKTDPMGNVTTYVYTDNGSNDTLIIAQATGLYTTQVRNSTGQITNITKTNYNPITAASATVLQSGLTTYNAKNQPVIQISYQTNYIKASDGSGAWVSGDFVTLTAYNSAGQMVANTQYANPLTATQVLSLGTTPSVADVLAMITPSASDQTNLTIYNDQDEWVASVFYQSGSATQPAGEYATIGNTTYVTPLTSTQVESLGTNPSVSELQALVTPNANDQVIISAWGASQTAQIAPRTISYTNADGTINTVTGNFVTIGNEGAHGMASIITYVTPVTAEQIASLGANPTVAQIEALATPCSNDWTTVSVWNDKGVMAAQVSNYQQTSMGWVQNAGYQAITISGGYGYNYSVTTTYATPLTNAQVASLEQTPTLANLQSMVTPSDSDQAGLSLFDSQGHIVAVVQYTNFSFADSTGQGGSAYGEYVTTMSYNSDGNLTNETYYATPLSATQVAALAANPTLATLQSMLTSSDSDQAHLTLYDANGLPVAQVGYTNDFTNLDGSINAAGDYVVITSYDGSGNATEQTSYATPLTTAQMASLIANPTWSYLQTMLIPSASDQTTQSIYNAQGQQVAQIQTQTSSVTAAGGTVSQVSGNFVTLMTYDASGNLIGSKLYTPPLTSQQMAALGASPTLSQLLTIMGLNGRAETQQFIYNAAGQQIAAIDPNDNASYTFYNADGQVSGTVDGTGHVIAYTYDAGRQIIQTMQYATPVSTSGWLSNGALTNSYPASLPIPASSSADVVITQIYDAAGNVVASFDSAGYVATAIYNGEGDVTGTTQYATPLTGAQLATLGAAPTLTALMADVTTSASDRTTVTLYDSDSRPIASIDPTGAVTAVSYDAQGDVLSTTVYATPLTTAQITALIGSPTLATLQTLLNPTEQTIYNANHQPVASITANGVVTITAYNANGGVTSVTTYARPLSLSQIVALGVAPSLASILAAVTSSTDDATSLTLYDTNNNPVATVSASGVVTESTFDAAGNVTSTTVYADALTAAQVASLDETPSLSALQGMVVSSTSDQTTYTVYNASEQAVATVSPMGFVTTTSYDASGNVVATTQYATALSSSQLQSLAADPTQATLGTLLTSSTDDQTSITLYDGQGRKAAAVNAGGQVTLYSYPSAENTVAITLAITLTSAQLQTLSQSPTLTTLDSQISAEGPVTTTSLSIYNSNEELVATVSSSGAVTTMSYDANGNLVSTIQYAIPLTTAQIQSLGTTPALAKLVALLTPSASDTASVTIYDQDNRVVATVSTTGVVHTTTYDANGNVTAQVQYATPLTTAKVESLGSPPTLSALENLVTPSLADQATITIYDAENRVIAEVSSNSNGGYLNTTTYDATGNVDVTVYYGNTPLNSMQLDALSTNPTLSSLLSLVPTSDLDTWSIRIYNSSNKLVGEVQLRNEYQPSVGYVEGYYAQTYTYDAQGNQAGTVEWNTPLALSQVVELAQSPSLQLLQGMITPSSSDYVSVSLYDEQGREIASVSNGYVDTTTYSANAVVSTEYGSPLTMSQQEALAQDPSLSQLQSLITPGPSDHIQISINNASDRQVASVNYYGLATVYTYDGDGDLLATTRYATKLTPEQLSGLGGAPTLSDLQAILTPSAGDQTSLEFYNADNQVIATVGPQGNVTTTNYDAAGNMVYQRDYATYLTSAQLSALIGNPTLSQLQSDLTVTLSDAVTLNIYDSNERKVATVNPSYMYDPSTESYDWGGHVTTTSYSPGGNVVDVLAYNTLLTASQLASLGTNPTLSALEALLTPSSVNLQSSINIYDASNNLVASVVGSYYYNSSTGYYQYGYLAHQYEYGPQGQTGWINYATPLSSAQMNALALNPTLANFRSIVTSSASDQTALTITNGQTVTNLNAT
jgi:YD repeat-containing protein